MLPGHTIGIVCTARKITQQELQPAIDIITQRGYRVQLGATIGQTDNQFGGTDAQRLADLQAMLNAPDVHAILCARGGYGTVRLLDALDFTAFTRQPKWLVGYSDITALHAHIQQTLGIQTLHASMPINFAKNTPEALNSLFDALAGKPHNLQAPADTLNRLGEAQGVLVGGNLSVLYSISGSISDIDTEGKILFLEDLDEYLYHIDRMMMQLKRSGKLRGLAGLVIGGMTDMNDNTIPFGKTAMQIIAEHVAAYNYPVAFNFPAGHLDDNRALVLGRRVQLAVDGQGGELSYL